MTQLGYDRFTSNCTDCNHAVVQRLRGSVVAFAIGEIDVSGKGRCKPLELGIADGISFLEDSKFDALRAGGRGEGAVVAPEKLTYVGLLRETFDQYVSAFCKVFPFLFTAFDGSLN